MQRFFVALPLLAFLPLFSSCSEGTETSERFVRSVIVTTPRPQGASTTKSFSGRVVENKSVAVGFKTPGQIKHIAVREGDFVRQGQLLASLDSKDYQLGLDAAQSQYDQLLHEAERTKKLFDANAVSANDYEKLTAGLRQLEVQLQSYKNKIEYTSLFAPVSGYVTSVLFEESEMVDAGTQVFSVMDSRHSEVEIDVPADVFLNRDKITSISATSSFHPDSYPLHIVTTNPKADANQLYHLRLAFTSTPPSNLTAGLNVSVSVEMSSASPSGYSLPVHSLVARPDGSRFVWTVSPDSSIVVRDVVVSSVTSDGLALISSGVSPADKVVKAGGSHLHPDDKVVIISSSK